MAQIIKKLLLMFAYGIMLILGAMFTVWASWKAVEFTSGDGKLTAQSGEKLTLSKRNEMVSRVRGIFTDSNGNVGIGTNSPKRIFEVYGELRINTQSGTLCDDPNDYGTIKFVNDHFYGCTTRGWKRMELE